MIRVPIGPRRKQNCEICGNKIEIKEFGYQSAGTPGFTYTFPYPQIIHLEHADTFGPENVYHGHPGTSRPEIVKEICQECMAEFGKSVEQFFPDWVPPEPAPTYNDFLNWLRSQGR